jgi:hypothetical protein
VIVLSVLTLLWTALNFGFALGQPNRGGAWLAERLTLLAFAVVMSAPAFAITLGYWWWTSRRDEDDEWR